MTSGRVWTAIFRLIPMSHYFFQHFKTTNTQYKPWTPRKNSVIYFYDTERAIQPIIFKQSIYTCNFFLFFLNSVMFHFVLCHMLFVFLI